MKLKLQTIFKGDKYTIGRFYIDDMYFSDTIEDTVRIIGRDCSKKIYGQTAIPEGIYKVEMLFWPKHNDIYPHLIDVPCFEGILIHAGIDQDSTEGCICVGYNKEKGKLQDGLSAINVLREILRHQKDVTIEIIREI